MVARWAEGWLHCAVNYLILSSPAGSGKSTERSFDRMVASEEYTMRKLCGIAIAFSCAGKLPAAAHAEAVKSIRLELPAQSTAAVEHIASILSRQIEQRCDARM